MDFSQYSKGVAAHFFLVDQVELDVDYHARAERFLFAAGDLYDRLDAFEPTDEMSEEETEVAIQTIFYDVGKQYYGVEKTILLEWFRDLYTLLRDQQQGPRIGTLVKLTGIPYFLDWLKNRIENPLRLERL